MEERLGAIREHIWLVRDWWRKWHTVPVLPWIRGARLYRQGRLSDAERHYRRGLEKYTAHPARFSAHLDLAHCLFKSRKMAEAEKHLLAVVRGCAGWREGYIRLARLKLWVGHPGEAAWTLHRCFKHLSPDVELVSLYCLAVAENSGPPQLIRDAKDLLLSMQTDGNQRLALARIRFALMQGRDEAGESELRALAVGENAPLEAVTLFAEHLLEDGKITYARHHLHRALRAAPEHPRVLSLLAKTYLEPGDNYNPEDAIGLATSACQHSGWLSPFAMHILAEAYVHHGDKMMALLVASRARDEGNRILSTYRDAKSLDQLIQTLSSGTQA